MFSGVLMGLEVAEIQWFLIPHKSILGMIDGIINEQLHSCSAGREHGFK